MAAYHSNAQAALSDSFKGINLDLAARITSKMSLLLVAVRVPSITKCSKHLPMNVPELCDQIESLNFLSGTPENSMS
jgi:hypothetical protein